MKKLHGWRLIRQLVNRRDKYKCQICLRGWGRGVEKRFDVHHVIEDQGGFGTWYNTLERVSMDDLLLLCHKCHMGLKGANKLVADEWWVQLEMLVGSNARLLNYYTRCL